MRVRVGSGLKYLLGRRGNEASNLPCELGLTRRVASLPRPLAKFLLPAFSARESRLPGSCGGGPAAKQLFEGIASLLEEELTCT